MAPLRIGKGTVAKTRIGAPERVYENIGGEIFSGPAVGTPWKMPIRFLEKSGTPIHISLSGDGGRKTVFQRSNRADWIKRLLATLAWKEARIDLGYSDAVVWIGSTRFQPTSADLAALGCDEDELSIGGSSVRTSVPRTAKVRNDDEGEDAMAKKNKKKKVKKVKRGKKATKLAPVGGGRGSCRTESVRFLVERVKRGVKVTIDGRPKTATIISNSVLEESVCQAAYAYTEKHIGPKSEIGSKGGGLYNRIRQALGDIPKPGGGKKKKSKKTKKVATRRAAKKGVVKKVHKRPITKKSGRKVVKKVRR